MLAERRCTVLGGGALSLYLDLMFFVDLSLVSRHLSGQEYRMPRTTIYVDR